MVKGLNRMSLTEDTVKLAIAEYVNERLKPGVNIKVTSFWEEEEGNLYSFWFKEDPTA